MQYWTCPECGSNLDLGESCDCTKKRPPPCHGNDLVEKEPTNHSVAPDAHSVNNGVVELSDLAFPVVVKDKELVAAIQEVHPKYDKTLHSKCKRGEDYGIQLRRSAIDAVVQKFGAVAHTAPKASKTDKRTLPCRISCRLSQTDYSALQLVIQREGYATTQDWLSTLVKQYIKRKGKTAS